MGEPLQRRSAPGIDGVFGAGDSFLDGEPAQHQPELRTLVTEEDIIVDRTDLQLQIGQGEDGIVRLCEKTARQADNIAGEYEIDDLPLAVAQQLITSRKAALDKAQLTIFIAVNNQVPTFIDHELGFEQAPQAHQIIVCQGKIAIEPYDERMASSLAYNYARTVHLGKPNKIDFD